MTYNVNYSQDAINELKKLDNSTVERIMKKLSETKQNPLQFFVRLSGKEDYKLRIGDYRVIVGLFHNDKIILVKSIGHRRNVYKK